MEKKAALSLSMQENTHSFSGPIILSNLIQAVYSLVGMVVVGHFAGSSGMTAVSMGAAGAALATICCSTHWRNFSLGTTKRLPIRMAGKLLSCTSSYALASPMPSVYNIFAK